MFPQEAFHHVLPFSQFFGKGFDARGDGERMFCPKGQRLKLRDGQGARIEIALRIGASGLKQESGLFLGFTPSAMTLMLISRAREMLNG